jgi:hypothetical protein
MDLWDVFKWSWGLILPHNWYLHRQLDKLQDEHVKRDEFNQTIDSIRREFREGSQQITYRLDALLRTLLQQKND